MTPKCGNSGTSTKRCCVVVGHQKPPRSRAKRYLMQSDGPLMNLYHCGVSRKAWLWPFLLPYPVI
jgi:hypothetical protein